MSKDVENSQSIIFCRYGNRRSICCKEATGSLTPTSSNNNNNNKKR